MLTFSLEEKIIMPPLTERNVQLERTRDKERGFDLVEPVTPFTEFIAPC